MVAFELAGVWLAIVTFLITHSVQSSSGQYLATTEDLDAWLRTTSANVNFLNDFSTPPGPLDVRIIYCSERIEGTNVCGGDCFAVQGPGERCLRPALRTVNCLASTRSLLMCFTADCNDCNLYTSCGTRLDNGFCFTPDTNSINLPVYANQTLPSSSSIPSSISSTQSFRPSSIVSSPPFASSSSASSAGSGQSFPVGAIVGIALGALAIIIATILFVLWIQKRGRHQDMREANLDPPDPGPHAQFAQVTPFVSTQRPPMPAPAPSTASNSSTGWAPPPAKGANFGYQGSHSTTSHSANASYSSSDASSSLAFRPPQGPAMDIIHEDSGERISSSVFRQSQMPPMEHPPPYTRA